MTVETPLDGNPDGGEQDANLNSSQAGSQPSSGNAESLEELKKKNRELEIQNKKLQSGKDKRWSTYEPLLKRLADKYGDEEIIAVSREAAIDEIIAERRGEVAQTPQSPAEVGKSTTIADVQRVIAEFKLDPNDPDVMKAALTDDPTFNLGKLVVKRQSNSTNTFVPPAEGSKITPPAPDSQEQLMKNYNKEKAAIPRGNIRALSDLQNRYRKVGLNI